MPWKVEILDNRVQRELASLSEDLRLSFQIIVEAIEKHGLVADDFPSRYIKHIEGKLWEMRMNGKDGIARAIYVTATRQRVVVLHAFVKKTQKTPKAALETARKRAKEIKP